MSRSTAIVSFIACLCIVSGCATSHRTSTSRPIDRGTIRIPSGTGDRIARAALDVLGTPYRYGGSNKEGFDCSGLVQYAHSQAGISIPRTTATQFDTAKTVAKELQIGDVLFFRINGRISHNGIYLGDGHFIHAPSTGKNVSIARTDNAYFRERLAGVRRFH